MTIHANHQEWLKARGLDPVMAEIMGWETIRKDSAYWLTVPFSENGQVINRKWRMTSEKRFMMDAGAPLLLWNADCLKAEGVQNGTDPVIITEGEADALALIQCEFSNVVSVPNGAPNDETPEPESAKRYEWVWRHIEDLQKVSCFIIAVDNDKAGINLATDLVSLLGAERCKFVEYPDGCKDFNDVLFKHGVFAVQEVIKAAKPYPIQGLFRLADFPERAEVKAYGTGVGPISDMIYVVPGTLTVLTGYANQGKSTLMNQILAHTMINHFPICVASFETDIKPILQDGLRCAMLGCGKNDLPNIDKRWADKILDERLMIISQAVDEDMEMDLDKFLDLCRIAVIRDGVKLVLLDPWNEIEHKRSRNESETDYIGRALRKIKRFIRQYNVAFWLVAHPTKPDKLAKDAVPGLYDIAGSAHFANKADYGMTYNRPNFDENRAQIIVNKVRMGLPGKRGSVEVSFDFRNSTFVEYGI